MRNSYPYLEFMRIARECRNILIADTLHTNSPDLYDALYSDCRSQIFQIKIELYEIKWLELHWDKINETINSTECSFTEKKELVAMYAKWYKDFVIHWKYTDFDTTIFEDRMNILKALISVNSEWEQEIKRVKVSFERSKKILNDKIKAIESEEK